MEIEYLYYFKELSVDMNMTKTAKRLFISQQSLSNYIQRLESEYETRLLIRTPRLKLTTAGKEMLKYAERILIEEKNIQHVLADINDQSVGEFTFGASQLRANRTLPKVLPQFSKFYPKLRLNVVTANTTDLIKYLLNYELDLALCLLTDAVAKINSTVIYNDKGYLCISERLLTRYFSTKEKNHIKKSSQRGAHLKYFENIPFFLMSSKNRIGNALEKCFNSAKFNPNIILSSKSDSFAAEVCNNATAGCFMTQSRLLAELPYMQKDINIFPIISNSSHLSFPLYLCCPENIYMSKYILYFKKLLYDYYSAMTTENLAYIVKSC